jgi:hypothetical protein
MKRMIHRNAGERIGVTTAEGGYFWFLFYGNNQKRREEADKDYT